MLRSILDIMRTKGGKSLTNEQWDALALTELGAEHSDGTITTLAGTEGWYQVSYLWAEVSMAAYIHAKESALQSKQKLFYVQACDHIVTTVPGMTRPRDYYKAFLEEPNVNHTKRLPAFCYLHLDMRVRITTYFPPGSQRTPSAPSVTGWVEMPTNSSCAHRPMSS